MTCTDSDCFNCPYPDCIKPESEFYQKPDRKEYYKQYYKNNRDNIVEKRRIRRHKQKTRYEYYHNRYLMGKQNNAKR